ncbi:MAG: cold shock domain-containing protein [Candidatus Devosia symbiotica]|nr:cold shock domain-containing protein [Candidatus Devosia symbiotica]
MADNWQGMMPRIGELVQWNNKGGYGFVRDDAGNDFYIHISKLAEGQLRPCIGDRLSFQIASGRNCRRAAINVAVATAMPLPPHSMRDVKRMPDDISRYKNRSAHSGRNDDDAADPARHCY